MKYSVQPELSHIYLRDSYCRDFRGYFCIAVTLSSKAVGLVWLVGLCFLLFSFKCEQDISIH